MLLAGIFLYSSTFLCTYACLRVAALLVRAIRKIRGGHPGHNRDRRVRIGKIMAHRGGRETTPENTMLAFENGAKHADCIEFDVWLTNDNQVVVFHDSDVSRMCGGFKGKINELDYLDLPKITKSPSEGHSQGSSNPHIPEKVRIPLLSQVLELAKKHKQLNFLVEFKQNSEVLAHTVSQMLKECNLVEDRHVVWFSQDHTTNLLLQKVDSSIPRCNSMRDIVVCLLAKKVGLLDLVSIPFQAFGIISVGEHPQELIKWMSNNPRFQMIPNFLLEVLGNFSFTLMNDRSLFDSIKERGLECWVLGVNTEAKLVAAKAMGCESFITDRPEWLSKALCK